MEFGKFLISENIEQGFIKSIVAEPEQLVNRLAYADWLEENDREDEASEWRKSEDKNFIRFNICCLRDNRVRSQSEPNRITDWQTIGIRSQSFSKSVELLKQIDCQLVRIFGEHTSHVFILTNKLFQETGEWSAPYLIDIVILGAYSYLRLEIQDVLFRASNISPEIKWFCENEV